MTVYDLTFETPNIIKTGDILNCPYNGQSVSIELPRGDYKLEVWGAQGGNSVYGGKGAYAKGIVNLANKTLAYIAVGGMGSQGNTSSTVSGGFNGGGNCPPSTSSWYSPYPQSGGGATDIRFKENSFYSRVIVAGGGGGSSGISGTGGYGGSAGGLDKANDGTLWCCGPVGKGATQTSGGPASGTASNGIYSGLAGKFGLGGDGSPRGSYNAGSGGGGGWYGGGGSSGGCGGSGGGGGSGYVFTESTKLFYPVGNLLNDSFFLTNAETIAGNLSFPSIDGSVETGHSGDGCARITTLELFGGIFTLNGEEKYYEKRWILVNGKLKEIDTIWTKINGELKQA